MLDEKSQVALEEIAAIGPTIDMKDNNVDLVPGLVLIVYAALHHCGLVDQADEYYDTAVCKYLQGGIFRDRVERLRNGKNLSLAEIDE